MKDELTALLVREDHIISRMDIEPLVEVICDEIPAIDAAGDLLKALEDLVDAVEAIDGFDPIIGPARKPRAQKRTAHHSASEGTLSMSKHTPGPMEH